MVTLGWTKAIKLIFVLVSIVLCLTIEYARTAAPSRNAPSFVIVIANPILLGRDDDDDDDDHDDDNDDDNDDDDDDDDDGGGGGVNFCDVTNVVLSLTT